MHLQISTHLILKKVLKRSRQFILKDFSLKTSAAPTRIQKMRQNLKLLKLKPLLKG